MPWNSYSQLRVGICRMPTRELLPGVTAASYPPAIVCDAHAELRRARRRAFVRDAVQLLLLIAVDWLFIHWPDSRLPFAGREESVAFLRGANIILFAHVWLSRMVPRWRARIVANTWCRAEREKFERYVSR